MAIQEINIGSAENAGDGDSLRVAGQKINANFNELATQWDNKAPLASPAFTGAPTAPTPAHGDNSTRIATSAFVSTVAASLSAALANKAGLLSPEFTGVPTAPTAAPGTNTLQLANTAFVQAAIAALVDSSPALLDTLAELSAALNDDPNFAATVAGQIAAKLDASAVSAYALANILSLADLAALHTLIGVGTGANQLVQLDALGKLPGVDGSQLINLPSAGGIPVGTTIWVNGTAAPTGFLKENGALVLRADYADLWAYAQASGRVVSEAAWTAGDWGAFSSGDGATTFRIPDSRGEFVRALDDGRGVDTGRLLGARQADAFKSHTHPNGLYSAGGGGGYWPSWSSAPAGGSAMNTSATGITETRPRNISKLACIKY